MKFIQNKTWMKIHLYLSIFLLPVALIYAVTGAGYIFGFKDDAGAKIIELKINEQVNENNVKDIMLKIIKENNLKLPSNTEIKNVKNSFVMGSIYRSFSLSKDKFKYTQRSIYGVLVLLHKSKAGVFFNILSVIFSITLFALYISGIFLVFKREKKKILAILGLGCLTTLILAYLSI